MRSENRRRRRLRLQSAMEYLMTYGWTILIIAVVLGALYYLGVFNGLTGAPRTQPGACHVFRPNGPGTTQFINLEGVCSGELPQYVGVLNGNGYVDVPSSTPFNSVSITVSAWVKANPQSNYVSIADRFGSSWSSTGSWSLHSNGPSPANKARWAISNSGPSPPYTDTVAVTFDGTWHFVTATYDGTTLSIYQDGVLQSQTTSAGLSLSSSYDVNLGRRNTGAQYFTGSIADVQIYNTALTASQVQYLYLEGIGGAPIELQYLVGWWPLNGDAVDYSGEYDSGTATGISYVSSWTTGYTPP